MQVLITAKLIAMLAIFTGSVAVGCAPIVLARCLRPLRQPPDCLYGRLVSLLLCFGGGVLLFTTFLHLLPECRRTFKMLEHSGRIRPLLEYFGIELSEICVCCGFFVVFAVEETVHFVLDRVHRVHDDIDEATSTDGHHRAAAAAVAVATSPMTMGTDAANATAEVGAIHRSMSMRRCADMDEYPNARQPSPPCLAAAVAHDFNHHGLVRNNNGRKHEPDPNESLLGTECPLYVSASGLASAPSMEAVSLFDHPTDNSAMYRRSGDADGCGGGAGSGGHVILTTATATGQSQQSLLARATSTFSMAQPTDAQRQQHHRHAQIRGVLRGLCAVLALSVHGLFEGLAVGLEQSATSVWYMSVAIATHKLVVVFCVGMELIGAAVRPAFIVVYVCGFAVVTPVGMALGMLLRLDVVGNDGNDGGSDTLLATTHDANDEDAFEVVAAVLQAMAAGTLLYVIFFEVLARDRSHPHRQAGRPPAPPPPDGLLNNGRRASHANRHHYHPDDSGFYRLFAIVAGFLVMFVLHLLTHSE